MNLVADESIDAAITVRLRQEGHRVWAVAEMAPGLTDEAVLALARDQGALLVTADKDFGELIFRQGRATHGVMLIRLNGLSADAKSEIVNTALKEHEPHLAKAFAVLTPDHLRVRRALNRG
ncbi:MAG: DUF5615 family PIN-like protein [Nitrospira sp.]|nr:DUF5615 family PIN-like protein [Nitrospira sp.]MDI3467047.1 hypothetical protein [Nitrospira sp.]